MTVNVENLLLYAYANEQVLKKPARGIVLNFHGLGYNKMKEEPDENDILLGEQGIVQILPYYGPWSWMNFQAVRLVDEIVQAAKERFSLSSDAPVLSTGGSMGGLSALIYTRYAQKTPTACAANCPVCDLVFHSTERPDLPRTMYAAFSHYECGLAMAMRLHSPLHQVPDMPNIPYLIVHGDADKAVNKAFHSDRFVQAMLEHGRTVRYLEVPGMEHCDIDSFPKIKSAYYDFIAGFFD